MELNYDRDGNPISLEEWMRLWSDSDYRQIGHHAEPDGAEVSTVWLGIDHAFGRGVPLIFETMVFGGELDQEQERYPDLEAARAGHARWVAAVKAA